MSEPIRIMGCLAKNTIAELHTDPERFRESAADQAWAFAAWVDGTTLDGEPLQTVLRRIVDVAWNECTESEEVPSTKWADQVIARALAAKPKGGAA